MISKNHGRYFFDIPGEDHLIPDPLPNGLFSIEDGRLRYDAQVEANLPQQEIPVGGGEDEEVEQGGPEQDVQPPNYYTTFEDIYALKGNIQNMNNLSINLRYATASLATLFHD